jgi:hypothetical protein
VASELSPTGAPTRIIGGPSNWPGAEATVTGLESEAAGGAVAGEAFAGAEESVGGALGRGAGATATGIPGEGLATG